MPSCRDKSIAGVLKSDTHLERSVQVEHEASLHTFLLTVQALDTFQPPSTLHGQLLQVFCKSYVYFREE